MHDSPVVVQLGGAWIVAAIIGGITGLVEVALATELMARNPQPEPSSD